MTLTTVSLWITLLVGILLSIISYKITYNLENQAIRLEQSRATTLLTDKLLLELESSVSILNGIKGLYKASDNVTRTEFKVFTSDYLNSHPAIQALEWIPKITAEQVQQYQQQAIADGLTDFRISELIDGTISPSVTPKPNYYPVYYAEPLKSNHNVLGLDLSSNLARRITLEQAMHSGQPQATASIRLVQGDGEQRGILFFVPIFYASSLSTKPPEEQIRGFALGVFRIADLFRSAQLGLVHELDGLNFKLDDITSDSAELLYQNAEQMNTTPEWTLTNQLDVAGRTWQLSTLASEEYRLQRHSLLPNTVLFSGLGLTLLLAIYLRSMVTREQDIRNQVSLRTQQLKESEARNKLIVDNAANGVLAISGDRTIMSVNPAAERIFDYSAEQLIGTAIKDIIPDLTEYHVHSMPDINISKTGLRKNGSAFPLNISLGTSQSGAQKTLIAIVYDDTQRQEAEQQLRRGMQAAEEANRQKSMFLNMMSHELRTPLTVILGYIPLLQNPERLPTQDIVKQIADDISVSGNHLLSLIDDLLDISKIEAGQMALHTSLCQVDIIINEILQHFDHQAKKQQLQLINKVADVELNVDPKRFRQILFNLVGNALKFTHQGTIEISAESHSSYVKFSVRDTGIGIPEHALNTIFDVFKQVDNSSTRKVSGSGLGLAITQRLVELHGGSLSVSSVEAQGSEFMFTLPTGKE